MAAIPVTLKSYSAILIDLVELNSSLNSFSSSSSTPAAASETSLPLPSVIGLPSPTPLPKIWLDPGKSNISLSGCINERFLLEEASPIALLKAHKNETELSGIRNAHIRDATAMCKFLAWIEGMPHAELSSHTEASVATRLLAFRSENKDFMGLSFETISGMGSNGAIIHHRPDPITPRAMGVGMYLCDSGAQYRDGTTDITRTVYLGSGEPSAFEKRCFTRVLQGHIALARAIFPPNTCGLKLDALARGPLWRDGLDYAHGTGHGIGHFLNVHEGPHGISSSIANQVMLQTGLGEGMIVSNEPGYYHDGQFGIRIENVVAVCKAQTDHHFQGKQFLEFETLTMVPLQRKLIELALLSPDERAWIDAYHAQCMSKVGPFVHGDVRTWLELSCTRLV